jgi:hypothetical protein
VIRLVAIATLLFAVLAGAFVMPGGAAAAPRYPGYYTPRPVYVPTRSPYRYYGLKYFYGRDIYHQRPYNRTHITGTHSVPPGVIMEQSDPIYLGSGDAPTKR